MIDSIHVERMHLLQMFVKDDKIKEPLKNLIIDQTDFTKKSITHILEFVDSFMEFLYKPYKK